MPPASRVTRKSANTSSAQGSGEHGGRDSLDLVENPGNNENPPVDDPVSQALDHQYEALQAFLQANKLEEADLWYLDDNDLPDLILRVQLRRFRSSRAPPTTSGMNGDNNPIPEDGWFTPVSTAPRAHWATPSLGVSPAPTFAANSHAYPQTWAREEAAGHSYFNPRDDVASQVNHSSLADHLRGSAPQAPAAGTEDLLYRGLSALSKVPLPEGGKYLGQQDARPIVCLLSDISSTAADFHLNAADTYLHLTQCLGPMVYKQLSKHIRRLGLSSAGSLQKLHEAESFLRHRYKTTNNDGKFAARVDSLKMERNETPSSFVDRLNALLDEGLDIGVQHTPYQRKQLFIRGLSTHYRDQACSVWSNITDVNELAELLTGWDGQRRQYSQNMTGNHTAATDDTTTTTVNFDKMAPRATGSGDPSPIRRGNCYRCGKFGHRAGRCRSTTVFQLDRRCSKCGDFSHCLAECMRTLLSPCPRCQKPNHMAAVCIEPSIHDNQATPSPTTDGRPTTTTESALMATHVDTTLTYSSTTPNSEPKLSDDRVTVPILPPLHRHCRVLPPLEDDHQGILCRAQIDNGAGACYIDSTLLEDLHKRGLHYEERPTNVTYRTVFGNNEVQHHNTAVILRFRLCSDDTPNNTDPTSQVIELPFLVARPCTPRLLFGRPALSFLDAPASGNYTLFDETKTSKGTTKLKANIPMLETASVMPRTESSRSRSTTDRRILADVCDRMVADGKLVRIPPNDEHKIICINEPVLVDKQEGLRVRRHPIPSTDANRYRLTIDLRSVNELQFYDGNWVAPRTVHSKNIAAPQRPYQFQDTAATLLRDFPPSCRSWYSKIDLTDAFSSIGISPQLGDKLFGIRISVPGEERPRLYAGRCLIQGWRWSSLIFARAVRHILNKLTLPPGTHICHVQDDVIIGAHCKEACLSLQRQVIELFKSHDFTVREDKCGDGPTITFCGLKADSYAILPSPKHPIDDKAIAHCLKELNDIVTIDDLLGLLRRWAGLFQYCKQWLPPSGQAALSDLYSLIGKASQCDADLDDILCGANPPLRSLGHLYVRGLPSLYLFRPWAVATLLVTDANIDNWAGVALTVIQVPSDFFNNSNIPNFGAHFDDLRDLCLQEGIVTARDGHQILCLPAVFDGGSFHSNSFPGSSLAMTRSSTFRERAAQILFANRNSGILAGSVYGVTDNANTTKEWQSAVTDFCGAWHSLYSNYISMVERVLWLPRTSPTVTLIDAIARDCSTRDDDPEAASTSKTADIDMNAANQDYPSDNDEDFIAPLTGDTNWSSDVKQHLDLKRLRALTPSDPEAQHIAKKPGYFWSNGTSGLLIRRIRHDLGGRVVLQIFIPKQCREDLVKEVHLECSHGKSPNVASRLARFCWFPSMKRFAAQTIRRCASCQLVDPQGQQLPPPGSRSVNPKPWFEVGIDLVGPIKVSNGPDSTPTSASLLTVTCAFTGFTALYPLSGSFKAKDICDGLSVIFCRHGFPVRLRCDRAKAHLSKYMNDYCKLYGIVIRYSAPRSPWTLGWVETRHRIINSTLARLLEGAGRSWDDPVTFAMLENCINSYGLEYEGGENVCPYELMYGFAPCSALQARLRIDREDSDLEDVETDDPMELVTSARNKAVHLEKLHQRFVSVWQDRRERAYESALNKSTNQPSERPVQMGDKVLVLGRREHKWSRRFRGPFKVIKMVGKRLAVLLHECTNVIEEHHVKNLKLFHDEEYVEDPQHSEEEDQLVYELPENDAVDAPIFQDDDNDEDQDVCARPASKPVRAAKERALRAIHQQALDDEDAHL